VRDKVAIHDVVMDSLGASLFHLKDLLAQSSEIRRQDRRCDVNHAIILVKFQEPNPKNQIPRTKNSVPANKSTWFLEFGSWFLRFLFGNNPCNRPSLSI